MGHYVRDWMARELSEQARPRQPGERTNTRRSIVEPSEGIFALQKQMREGDRRIAILQSKLEALKVIDHELDSRKRAVRLPSTLPLSGD